MPNISEEARIFAALKGPMASGQPITGFGNTPAATPTNGAVMNIDGMNAIAFHCTLAKGPGSQAQMVTALLQQSFDGQNWFPYGGLQSGLGVAVVGAELAPMIGTTTTAQGVATQLQQPVSVLTTWSWIIDGSQQIFPRLNCNFLQLFNVTVVGGTSADLLSITARAKRFIG